jgi:hypothetical protein
LDATTKKLIDKLRELERAADSFEAQADSICLSLAVAGVRLKEE